MANKNTVMWVLPTVASYRKGIVEKCVSVALEQGYTSLLIAGREDRKRDVRSISKVANCNVVLLEYRQFIQLEFYLGLMLVIYKNLFAARILIINPRRNSIQHLLIMLIFRITGKKIIVWGNNFRSDRDARSLKNWIKNIIETYISLCSSTIIGYSPKNNYKISDGSFLPAYNVSSYMIGTDHQRQYKSFNRKLRLVYWGGLKQGKGLEELCTAVHSYNVDIGSLVVDIYGTGPMESTLRDKFQHSYIKFKGYLDIVNTDHFHEKYDAFILPGLGGLAPLDAVKVGLPIITTDGDGTLSYIVEKYEFGILISESTHQDILKSIISFYAQQDIIVNNLNQNRLQFLEDCKKLNLVSQFSRILSP